MKVLYATLIVLAMTQSAALGEQAHWNQFLGPNGDAKSTAKLPVEFSESKNVRWKIPIHGEGWSSPVIWGNQIWLTTGSDESKELFAVCVDLDNGKILHDIKVFDVIKTPQNEAYAFRSPHLNSPATPTPVVEEGRVYVHFGSQGTACLDTDSGEKIWERRDLHCDHVVRPGSSPIVDGDSLFVAYDGIDNQFFVALDKKTGDTRWLQDRNVQSDWAATLQARGIEPSTQKKTKPGDNKKSYATAHIIEHDGRRQLIAPAAEATISYDPKTGEEFWRVHHLGGFNVAARPLFENGLVYVFTSGLTGHLLAVRPDGTGDVTDSHVAWTTTKSTPHIPSPIIVDDAMFLVTQKGIARCLNSKTGEENWIKRVGGSHWASPLYANGNIYFFNKGGDVEVFMASKDTVKSIAKNSLNGEIIASPAVAGESMILRSTTHLYCIAEGYERTSEQVAADKRNRSAKEVKGNPVAGGKGTAVDLEELVSRLKAAVKSGKMSAADAKAKFAAVANQQQTGKASASRNGKGPGKKAGGETGFYAIVIGRLKSKDVELGEFTLEVDHVNSMYSGRWVKDAIIGKTVTVTGVSGKFRDNLLLIKRGETLKFRSGSYSEDSNSLGFGFKFHVLERTAPFDPDAVGVPPEEFRGFRGVLLGKIVELDQSYEVLLRVDEVVKLADGNRATDANSIKGKLVRLIGFFQHQNKFKDLHEGDTIRAGATHADRTHDEFGVTDVLEKIGQD